MITAAGHKRQLRGVVPIVATNDEQQIFHRQQTREAKGKRMEGKQRLQEKRRVREMGKRGQEDGG